MVESFIAGERPKENFSDGVAVTELLMTAYMSVEKDKTILFPPPEEEKGLSYLFPHSYMRSLKAQ